MSKSNYYKKLGQCGWNDENHTSRSLEDDFYEDDMKQKPSTGKKKSKKQAPKKCDHTFMPSPLGEKALGASRDDSASLMKKGES